MLVVSYGWHHYPGPGNHTTGKVNLIFEVTDSSAKKGSLHIYINGNRVKKNNRAAG